MPRSIKSEDKPVSIIIDQSMQQTMYGVVDAHGVTRAYFVDKEDAEEFELFANAPVVTLLQEGMHDTGTEPVPKKQAQPEGAVMPKGKKKAKKTAKKAASVKKVVQKTMKRRKKRKA